MMMDMTTFDRGVVVQGRKKGRGVRNTARTERHARRETEVGDD